MTTRSLTARRAATPRWPDNEAGCCLIRFFAKVREIRLKPKSRATIDRIDKSSDDYHRDVRIFLASASPLRSRPLTPQSPRSKDVMAVVWACSPLIRDPNER